MSMWKLLIRDTLSMALHRAVRSHLCLIFPCWCCPLRFCHLVCVWQGVKTNLSLDWNWGMLFSIRPHVVTIFDFTMFVFRHFEDLNVFPFPSLSTHGALFILTWPQQAFFVSMLLLNLLIIVTLSINQRSDLQFTFTISLDTSYSNLFLPSFSKTNCISSLSTSATSK